jgi:DNA-binding beta-propeller fold protein YncE
MRRLLLAPLFLLAAALACEPNRGDGPAPGQAPASSAITIAANDTLLLIAAEDHDELLVVDRETREVKDRISVGDGPTHVITLPSGVAVVSNRYGHTLSVVDMTQMKVTQTITVGVEPIGMTSLGGSRIAVALAGEEALAIVDIDAGTIEKKIDLGTKDPRAVAKTTRDGILVSHLGTGVLSRVDVETGLVTTLDMTTTNEFGPTVFPNHLRSLTVSPDGETVLIAHSQSNADTVRAPIDEGGFDEFGGGGGNCGYSGCATELGAVVPAITEVQVSTGEIIVPIRAEPETTNADMNGGMAREADCFDCGFGVSSAPNPPSFLNPFESRFTGLSLNNPTAVAAIDGERGLLVVHAGTKNAVILRRPLRGTADDVVGYVQLGNGASAVTLTSDGSRAYVWNQFDASITEIEIPKLDARSDTPSRFAQNGTTASSEEFKAVAEFDATTTALVEDALPTDASLGRKLFHDATDARISRNHAISCASCHPDGRTDGRTWQFTFGPRNTPQLGGSILDTAPFHWPGDVTTHRELNNMTVLAFMGGAGLDVESMDAIGAFIDTIRAAPSRTVLAETLPEAVERGRALFLDPSVGCTNCHNGTHFTDNRNWDIGSQAAFNDITSFQTPVLHGLSRSAPYLHDGSAPTLRALVDNWVATDRMGTGSHLTRAELDDLVAYLDTL